MSKKRIPDIRLGDFLGENIFRHDGLLAMPKGISIKEKEKDNLKELKVDEVITEPFDYNREHTDDETFSIIEETFENATFWDARTTKKIVGDIRTRLRKKKKLLNLLTLLRQADYYSFVSSLNISIIIGDVMYEGKVNRAFIDFVFYALIHDIGKIKVTDLTMQNKELTENEFRAIRNHPIYSFETLQKLGFSRKYVLFSLQTHEKWNGTGYPYGLYKKEIQAFAQIISIVEMYNAMSSPRPHRTSFHLIDVLDKIRNEQNSAFGEEYIEFFEYNFRPYKKGMFVELNNGMIGRIEEINERNPLFPEVALFNENTGEKVTSVKLYHERELRIVKINKSYD